MHSMQTAFIIGLGLSRLVQVATAEENAPLPPLASVFEQARSDKEDVVYFRNKDVLRGTVLNETLGIETPYGSVKVALRRCAGVSFEGSGANTETLVTVNRNRLTGLISDRGIRLRIGSSGEELEVRKEKIRFIVLRRSPEELDFVDSRKDRDLFVMANGDLLTGMPAEPKVTVKTDYGSVGVAFDEIRQIEMQGGGNVTAVVTKKNKDVVRGTLETEDLTLQLDLGVSIEGVYKDKFAKLFVSPIPDGVLVGSGVAVRPSVLPAPPTIEKPTDLEGRLAPSFSLLTVEGEAVSNARLADTKATVLDFFATNCGYCAKQIPRLETIRKEFASTGVRFVAVQETMQGKEFDKDETAFKLKTLGWNGEWAPDPNNKVGKSFGATGFPTMVLVTSDGVVAVVNVGNLADLEDRVRGQLRKLIE